jgi:26S proteasome regulatory subunit (ATPase 3-interacting protein)
MLASQGVKKSQAEKALDALADKGSVVRKEFGKTKIYFPSQEGLAELEPEVSRKIHTFSPLSPLPPPPH